MQWSSSWRRTDLYYFAVRAMGPTGKLGPVSPMGSFRSFTRHWPALPPPMAAEDHGRAGKEAGPALKVRSFSEMHKVNPQTAALLESGPVWTGMSSRRGRKTNSSLST